MSLEMRNEFNFEDYVRERLDSMDKKLSRLDHGINGNGQPGLKTDVARLQTKITIFGAVLGVMAPVALGAFGKALGWL